MALKFPVAVDAKVATFVCVDPWLTTDSELRAWGVAHAPLWAALRTRTFAMHVVAVGPGAAAADRTASVLTHWTRDADGQAEMPPTGPTQADPDIRQELARLEDAIRGGNHVLLSQIDGWEKASELEPTPRGHADQDDRQGCH